MKASTTVRYWNLRLSISNGRTVAPSVLETVRKDAGLKDFTVTKEHILMERNLAKKKTTGDNHHCRGTEGKGTETESRGCSAGRR